MRGCVNPKPGPGLSVFEWSNLSTGTETDGGPRDFHFPHDHGENLRLESYPILAPTQDAFGGTVFMSPSGSGRERGYSVRAVEFSLSNRGIKIHCGLLGLSDPGLRLSAQPSQVFSPGRATRPHGCYRGVFPEKLKPLS